MFLGCFAFYYITLYDEIQIIKALNYDNNVQWFACFGYFPKKGGGW